MNQLSIAKKIFRPKFLAGEGEETYACSKAHPGIQHYHDVI